MLTSAAAARLSGPTVAAIGDFIARIGFPVVVSLVLLWSLLISQPAQLADVVQYLERLELRQTSEFERRSTEDQRRTEALLQLLARIDSSLKR